MSTPTEILICTQEDYNQILDELHEFWGARDTRHLHHPFLIHEFGNSAFVIRRRAQVVAYLFGFVSQTEPVGYVHTVAVRASARRQHRSCPMAWCSWGRSPRYTGVGRIGQLAIAGRLTAGSSLSGAMVSSVM
jgi:hypothetical protein